MSKRRVYTLQGKVVLWPGEQGNWHFVPVSKPESTSIKEDFGALAKGFHLLPVTVTVGKTIWVTSIFLDGRSGCYLLPLKAKVRKAEDIWVDDTLTYTIKIEI